MVREIEINIITLEDNNDYMIIGAVNNKENKYFILAKEDSPKDIVLRKVIEENGGEYLVKLDSEEEYEEVIALFNDKFNRKEGLDEE